MRRITIIQPPSSLPFLLLLLFSSFYILSYFLLIHPPPPLLLPPSSSVFSAPSSFLASSFFHPIFLLPSPSSSSASARSPARSPPPTNQSPSPFLCGPAHPQEHTSSLLPPSSPQFFPAGRPESNSPEHFFPSSSSFPSNSFPLLPIAPLPFPSSQFGQFPLPFQMPPPPFLLLQKHLLVVHFLLPILLLLFLLSISSASASALFSFSECLQLERSPMDGGRAAKVLSVREGMPAYFHCPRGQNGNGGGTKLKAAWTRMRDAALLAVGTDTFTVDLRFQVSKARDGDWVLILRRTELDDQGCYLCEVNTEPVSTLVPVYLKVNAIRTNVGEPKRRQNEAEDVDDGPDGQQRRRGTRLEARIEGATLVLNCTVDRGQEEPAFWPTVVWTKDGGPLDLRNNKKFSTDFRVANGAREALVFTLRVHQLSPGRDNGVYACQGDGLQRSAEIVSLPAGGGANSAARPPPPILLPLPIFFIFLPFVFPFLLSKS